MNIKSFYKKINPSRFWVSCYMKVLRLLYRMHIKADLLRFKPFPI